MKNLSYRLVQFHTDTISKPDNSPISNYYKKIWEQDHYLKPEAFWELPKWAGELSYCLEHNGIAHEFEVLTEAKKLSDYRVYGSVLECNKHLFKKLVLKNPQATFILGGYVGKETMDVHNNVVWFDSIESYCKGDGLSYKFGTSWRLFEAVECIPRITLSYGCTHKCKFCTIPNEITEVGINEVLTQVLALQPLKFELVYIDDKTFGQSANHTLLRALGDVIRAFNPSFVGFIVQTTAAMVKRVAWDDLNVYAVEVGVESFNNAILKSMNKPATTGLVLEAEHILMLRGIKYIPNIVVGFPTENEDTYSKTIKYIQNSTYNHLNIYNLAVYEDSELASEIDVKCAEDQDECSSSKSYNSKKQNALNSKVINTMALNYINR